MITDICALRENMGMKKLKSVRCDFKNILNDRSSLIMEYNTPKLVPENTLKKGSSRTNGSPAVPTSHKVRKIHNVFLYKYLYTYNML